MTHEQHNMHSRSNLFGILDMIGHPSCPVSLTNQFLQYINSKGSQNIRAKDARKGGKRKEERKRRQSLNIEIIIRFFEGCWHLLRER